MILELYKGNIAELNVSALVRFLDGRSAEISESRKTRAKKQIKAGKDGFPSNVLKISDKCCLTSVGVPLDFFVDREFFTLLTKHSSENPETIVLVSNDKEAVAKAEECCRNLYKKNSPELTIVSYRTAKREDIGRLLPILNAACMEEHGFGIDVNKAADVFLNIERYFIAHTFGGC